MVTTIEVTPRMIRRVRRALGMNQGQVGRLIGRGTESISVWEREDRRVPRPAADLIVGMDQAIARSTFGQIEEARTKLDDVLKAGLVVGAAILFIGYLAR